MHTTAVTPLITCMSSLQLSESVRDAKLALIKELKPDVPDEASLAESITAELLKEWPKHLHCYWRL